MPENSEEIKKAKAYGFLLLKYRPRSIAEFTEKLNKRGFGEGITNELVLDFKKRGLLDDIKFAKAWISDRMNLKPMGRSKLKQELKEKGVSEFDIEDVIGNENSEIDELETARKLACKRIMLLKGMDRITAKRRLFGYLQRRGFTYEVVLKAVREALKNES